MALSIIRERCNVEIELQPLLCVVNLNVEYALVRQHLGRILIQHRKASGKRWVSVPEDDGRGRNKRRREGHPAEAKQKDRT